MKLLRKFKKAKRSARGAVKFAKKHKGQVKKLRKAFRKGSNIARKGLRVGSKVANAAGFTQVGSALKAGARGVGALQRMERKATKRGRKLQKKIPAKYRKQIV